MFPFIQLLLVSRTLADIIRRDTEFDVEFSIVKQGRLVNNVLMYVEDIDLGRCLYTCVQHLQCRTINYNHHLRQCEVVDIDFDYTKAITDEGSWWNFGTASSVHGGYSQWTSWGVCNKTCGVGVRNRTRICDTPSLSNGGMDCTLLNEPTEYINCNLQDCPDTCAKIIKRSIEEPPVKSPLNIGGLTESVSCAYYQDVLYMKFGHDHTTIKRFQQVSGTNSKIVMNYTNTIPFIQEAIQESSLCVQHFKIKSNKVQGNQVIFESTSGKTIRANSPKCIGCSNLFKNQDGILEGWAKIEDKTMLPLKMISFNDVDGADEWVEITLRKFMCKDLVR